ncbi:hypothetical protein Tco_0361160 [Tanacetum coccineum]
MTPRSCLRWKPTGRIFKIVGLRWVPTGKIFTSSTTKVDSESTNGSDEDITNQYEYKQTLDVSVGHGPNSKAPGHNGAGPEITNLQSGRIGSGLVTTPTAPSVPPTEKQLSELFQPLFDEDEGIFHRSEYTITTSGSESFENSVTNEFDSEASSSGTVNVKSLLQTDKPYR